LPPTGVSDLVIASLLGVLGNPFSQTSSTVKPSVSDIILVFPGSKTGVPSDISKYLYSKVVVLSSITSGRVQMLSMQVSNLASCTFQLPNEL